jgi:hypothetical protein
MKKDKHNLAVGQNCKKMAKNVLIQNQARCFTPIIFVYLYNYGHLRKKSTEEKWHGKCTVFNPVEPFRRHVYGTYLVFTATNLIAREERI